MTESTPFGGAVSVAVKVLAPTGAATAILYYFGYVREQALFSYFGVDLGTTGFSAADYLVRSAGVGFAPLTALLALAAAALAANPIVNVILPRFSARVVTTVVCIAGVAATALFAIAAGAVLSPTKTIGPAILAPLALGGSTLTIGYLLALARPQRHLRMPRPLRTALTADRTPRTAVLVALTLVAMFWATADIGAQHGIATARTIELALPTQPQAILYSRQKLHISGPGVTIHSIDPHNAVYGYRYNGLRVLLHSGGHWLLVPAAWRHDNGATTIILDDSDPATRVDLAP